MEKGKIFLRLSADNNLIRPYSIETDRPDYVLENDLGVIALLPIPDSEKWIFGLSAKNQHAIHFALGVVDHPRDLTNIVYAGSIMYGKNLARITPGEFEFIDEVIRPTNLEISCLSHAPFR